MQSSASTSTSGRPPKAPQQQPQQQPQQPAQRMSVSPSTSSLGTPYVDSLYSHPSDAFGPAPADILPPPSAQPPPAQSFAYAHLPTHSDELGRVHVFQSADTWLAPQPQPHRHQPQAQAHAQQQQQLPHVRMYAHQSAASYGTPPNTDTFNAFVASLDAQGHAAAAQGQQDAGVDMWQTMPTGYEFVFPFTSGAGGGAGGHFVAGAAVGQLEMSMIG